MRVLRLVYIFLLILISINAEEPKIIAHRGDSLLAPENTIPAFKLAWENGADAIEGDFHLTKDGHIVCIHDANTKRISNLNLTVKNSTLEELRKLDVGISHGKMFSGVIIPTIAEVFLTIPDKKNIYIEIKCGEEIIPKLLEEIAKTSLKPEQITVISFHTKVIQAIKIKAPQFKAYWLSDFEENMFSDISPSLETVLKTLSTIKADGFCSSKNLINESFIKGVIKGGYEYHVWTIDDLETARRFKKWGAKSIITNKPGYLRENLIEQMK